MTDNRLINCPFHEDRTASMKIYGPVAYCFGCHMSVPTKELNLIGEPKHFAKPEPTNIPKRIEYIKTLSKSRHRGFDFHADSTGFYLIWPGDKYYKKRTFNANTKYICPSGVKAPLLVFPGVKDHLIVVEGELNAMSLYEAVYGDYVVCSPGSAGEFMRHIALYKHYRRVTLILDYDSAGIVHGSQTKEVLLKDGVNATLELVKRDFNEIYQEGGEEAVRREFERIMK